MRAIIKSVLIRQRDKCDMTELYDMVMDHSECVCPGVKGMTLILTTLEFCCIKNGEHTKGYF